MGDIAQAALGKKIERKSEIIHSLPENSEDSSSGEHETTTESNDVADKQRSGAALKNLFTALADGQAASIDAEEEATVKEKKQPESTKRDSQVS